jgi:hypothetical protein
MTPAYLKISVGGRSHTNLRAELSRCLLSFGFVKMKARKTLTSSFVRMAITEDESVRLLAALYAIANAFGPGGAIKELRIMSFPDINVHLLRHKSR